MKRITFVVLLLTMIPLANGQSGQIFAQSYDLAFVHLLQNLSDDGRDDLALRLDQCEGDGFDLNWTCQLAQTYQKYGYNVTYLFRELPKCGSRPGNQSFYYKLSLPLYHMWLVVQNPADQKYIAVDPYDGVILTPEVFIANGFDVGQNRPESESPTSWKRYVVIKNHIFTTPDDIARLYYPAEEFYRVRDGYRLCDRANPAEMEPNLIPVSKGYVAESGSSQDFFKTPAGYTGWFFKQNKTAGQGYTLDEMGKAERQAEALLKLNPMINEDMFD